MTNIPDLIERLIAAECAGSVYPMMLESAQALRDLQAELSVWKPNTASEGHGCPACGREYSLEENQAKQIADLQAVADAAEFVVARYTGGCETFIAPANCVSAGRKRDAEYGADQWCDVCVLREALAKLDKHE